uniref:Mucolipin-3 n=1 Tax=Magallana gigas TaxID=29159 RepID=K1REV9_MAGGI
MADNKELKLKEDNLKVSGNGEPEKQRLESQPRSNHRPRINELTNMASTNILPDDIDNTAGQTTETPNPKKPMKRMASFYTPYMEDRLRRKLKFYFMGPHEKFKAKRKCPWKLLLQIFKVFLVTAQLVMFGYQRALFVEYVEKNNIAMKHMYLQQWDPSFETMPYPPATGLYAIYTATDLVDHINFAMNRHQFRSEFVIRIAADEDDDKVEQMLFDIFVILVSVFSSFLCIRSLYRAHNLRVETVQFFKTRHRKDLSFHDRFEFVNLWYVLIVINDVLTVVGSSFKIQLERRHAQSSSENYDICALMLGIGSLLVWMGVIRYIGFFKTFNILTVVLKKACPDLMRFLVTTMMLYLGFMFCGWAFRHLSTTSECLFSLVNGDDMFTTFSATVTEDIVVWYFSRIYLYLFISLFIYAVLNLFIAVILDTYETIKEYYEKGFPKSELFEFIDQCEDAPDSELYRGEDNACSCSVLSFLCCFCCKKSNMVVIKEQLEFIVLVYSG